MTIPEPSASDDMTVEANSASTSLIGSTSESNIRTVKPLVGIYNRTVATATIFIR